jgi:aquaporin TIP
VRRSPALSLAQAGFSHGVSKHSPEHALHTGQPLPGLTLMCPSDSWLLCASQGYTLFASAFIGGPLTGAALNPARVFGPALVYGCYWHSAPIYMLAQYCGGAIAALIAMLLYGPGPEHGGGEYEAEPALTGVAVAPGSLGAGASKAAERAGLIAMSAHGSSSGQQPGHWADRY